MQPRVRFGAVALSAALALTACSDGDGTVEPIDPPDATGEPSEPEPPEEPEEPDGPEIFQGQLYPPLPDLEPDPRGGDEDIQREVLAVHAELYEIIEEALSTNEVDEGRLGELAGPEFVDLLVQEVESQVTAERVSVSSDSQVVWVRASVFEEEAEALVLNCVEIGPETGAYEVETGEPAGLAGEEETLLRTFTYELGDGRWRATGFTVTESEEACDALPQA